MPHHLGHEISNGFRRPILHLAGGAGVGAQGEACVAVPQYTIAALLINGAPYRITTIFLCKHREV